MVHKANAEDLPPPSLAPSPTLRGGREGGLMDTVDAAPSSTLRGGREGQAGGPCYGTMNIPVHSGMGGVSPLSTLPCQVSSVMRWSGGISNS